MKLEKIPKGTYIIAVSGGVDSVVLLDVLRKRHADSTWIVAHIDHGMRPDSAADARFVAGLAEKYGLQFEHCSLSLGAEAGETEARHKRYEFLRNMAKKHAASGIITAHHADDVVETVVLNLLRGTGWRGVSSLQSSAEVSRPLIGVDKKDILDYAQRNKLEWCEDITNRDRRYFRNKIRHEIIPRAAAQDKRFKEKIYQLWQKQRVLRKEFEFELTNLLNGSELHKDTLLAVDEPLALEILRQFLLERGVRQTRPQLKRAYGFVKTGENGKRFSLGKQKFLCIKSGALVVTNS